MTTLCRTASSRNSSYRLATTHPFQCRVCLEPSGIIPIFGDGIKPDISIDVIVFGTIALSKKDPFTKFLCEKCHDLLQNAISFRRAAKHADALMRKTDKYTFNVHVKTENTDGADMNESVFKDDTENLEDDISNSVKEVTTAFDTCENEGMKSNIDNGVEFFAVPADKTILVRCACCKIKFQSFIEYEDHCLTSEHINNIGSESLVKPASVLKEIIPKTKVYIIPKSKKIAPTDKNSHGNIEIKTQIVTVENINCSFCNVLLSKAEYPRHLKIKHGIVAENERRDRSSCTSCKIKFQSFRDYEDHCSTREHRNNIRSECLDKPACVSKAIALKLKAITSKCNDITAITKVIPKSKKITQKDKHQKCNSEKKTQTIAIKDTKCNICNVLFSKPGYLEHLRRKHVTSNKIIECPVCKKNFRAHYYPTHKKVHEKKNYYICDQCGKGFKYSSGLNAHLRLHSDNNDLPYKCDLCPYRGAYKYYLKIHLRNHTQSNFYKCDHCNHTSVTKGNLKRHLAKHEVGSKNKLICDLCKKGFRDKISLKKHLLIHSGITFICDLCGTTYSRRESLRKHMEKVHKQLQSKLPSMDIGSRVATYLKKKNQQQY